MQRIKEVDSYISFVKDNPKRVNKERKLLVKMVEPILDRDDVFFDRETYDKCIRYCETNFYKLFPYQKFIYAFVFMYNEQEFETTLFKTFFILMGRANGKDGCFMPLMNFLQTPLYGIKNYHIDIVANAEDQAKDSFNVVYEMLEAAKKKFRTLFYWTKEVIINTKTRSRLRFNTSNAQTKDGKQTGCVLMNEVHAYESYNQIKVFLSGLGKIKHPRVFIITTNGYVRDGPLDNYIDASLKILNGEENKQKIFPFICRIDDIKEIETEDEEQLEMVFEKANPSMPFMSTLRDTIFQDFYDMQSMPSLRPEFITKRMNLAERSKDTALTSWENILHTTYSDIVLKTPIKNDFDYEDRPCVIGIDYADIRDFASAGVLFKIDGVYIWRQKTWICRNNERFNAIKFPFDNYGSSEFQDFEVVDTQSIEPELIVEWCVSMMDKYYVKRIIMDNYKFKLMKQTFETYGIKTFNAKTRLGMVEMIRAMDSVSAFNAPIIVKAFSDHKINFGPSAIMRWYSNNTFITTNRAGKSVFRKVEPVLRKTDGFMAFNCAMYHEDMLEQKEIIVDF